MKRRESCNLSKKEAVITSGETGGIQRLPASNETSVDRGLLLVICLFIL